MPWRELPHATRDYVRVAVDPNRRLVRLTRTALPIPKENAKELLALFASEMANVLPPRARAQQRLLFDIRDSPRIAGPDLEPDVMSVFNQLMKDFGALAILLRTPIGVLQTRRLSRTAGLQTEAFYDEAEALQYLTSLNKESAEA